MKKLLRKSAVTLAKEIKTGRIGVNEIVKNYQKQIEKMEPKIHAFLPTKIEGLDQRIEEVEKGIRDGRYKGPLAGVPVAIKDNICTRGIKTTCASRMLEQFIPSYNAEVVERLQKAGMIVIGKTNMDEFAMGSTTETSYFGITRNPWNIKHVPGGSSGGSCAAIAAGEVPLALGSDTGGSIRQPASYCGLTGLKPTYGRVSRYGLIAYASSLDQVGPIGKTAADCAALYEILAGWDKKDSTSSLRSVESCQDVIQGNIVRQDLEGIKIGIPREYLGQGTEKEVYEAIEEAARLMEQNGAQVEYFSMDMTDYVVPTYYIIACAEASSNLARFDGVKYGYRNHQETELHRMYRKSRQEGFGEEVKRRILLGSFVLSSGYYEAYYLKALKTKTLIKREFDRTFSRYDCILTPVSPAAAPEIGASLSDPLQMYLSDIDTVAANLAGIPAVTLPCGINQKGLPIGLQILGNDFQEKKILTVAAAYERLRGEISLPWEEEYDD